VSIAQQLAKTGLDTQKLVTSGRDGSASPSSGSSDSSSANAAERRGARVRAVPRRRPRRLAKYLAEVIDQQLHGLSLLERHAITERSARAYVKELDSFTQWAKVETVTTVAISALDALLVTYMDKMFLDGEAPARGMKLLAATMHARPEFSKTGLFGLPRGWRALKGWTRLSPPRARTPEPLAIWAAMVNGLVSDKQPGMAMFTLMMWSTYARPGALLRLQPEFLIRPSSVAAMWTVLLNPLELEIPSKTREFDDSIPLDHKFWKELQPLLEALKGRTPASPVFTFTYPEYTLAFRKVAVRLGLKLVPYQARHSGASHDRITGFRDLPGVKKRGSWKADKSVNRYEKGARLGRAWELHSPVLRAHAEVCELKLTEVLLSLQPVLWRTP